jgi:hypothetical protein
VSTAPSAMMINPRIQSFRRMTSSQLLPGFKSGADPTAVLHLKPQFIKPGPFRDRALLGWDQVREPDFSSEPLCCNDSTGDGKVVTVRCRIDQRPAVGDWREKIDMTGEVMRPSTSGRPCIKAEQLPKSAT